MRTTEKMEQAMYFNHGFCYEEYEQCIHRKLRVERARAESYKQANELSRQLNNNIQ
ncbi:hypothetical protein [Alkalicoccus chagannorensis]|uniref:hypothetical protein n=1 Tax=Alkalicoccus chagannorensis TaxID=427072 RepID=UPI000403A4A0|nr:hypothetical protein [Alkalicoccus chagannorensis]